MNHKPVPLKANQLEGGPNFKREVVHLPYCHKTRWANE